jgi:hypothetical protein
MTMNRFIHQRFSEDWVSRWLMTRYWIQGSHSGDCEVFYLLGYNAMQYNESQLSFQSNILPPPSGSKSMASMKPTWSRQQVEPLLDASLAYIWTLKMEATCSSRTSADSQWTTWRNTPEDRILRSHYCENLKFSNWNVSCLLCSIMST